MGSTMVSYECPPMRLLLFVKHPEPGKVKTRLADAVGNETALALYNAFVLDSLETCARAGLCFTLCVHPPEKLDAVRQWLGDEHVYMAQEGADLGERMANAMQTAFDNGAEKAAVIGSDLPDLPPSLIRQADRELNRTDAVLGPARDGGYYLIAMRKETFCRQVFQSIDWSTGLVLDQTLTALEQAGCSVAMLPPWRDVDTVEDLAHLLRHGGSNGFAESYTMRAARALSLVPETNARDTPDGASPA